MGVLTSLLTLPVAGPMRGSFWVAGKIAEAADRELNDPAAIRRELRRLEEALLAGQLSEEAYEEAEIALLARLRDAGS